MIQSQDQLLDVPIIVEFVAVPNSFDIDHYLSMRESTNNFSNAEMNLDNVRFISDTIKSSPFFVLSKAPELTISSCLFCIEIFREIGLTLQSVSDQHENSIFRGQDFKRFLHYSYKNDSQESQVPFCIIVINTYQLVEEGVLEPIVEKIVEVEEYTKKIEATMEMVKANHA